MVVLFIVHNSLANHERWLLNRLGDRLEIQTSRVRAPAWV